MGKRSPEILGIKIAQEIKKKITVVQEKNKRYNVLASSRGHYQMQFTVAKTVFCVFESGRIRFDYLGLELFWFKWRCYFFKVTLHCSFYCV